MTKKDFIKRCENAYNMGLCTPELIKHIDRVVDAMSRLEGGQFDYFTDFIADERERLDRFASHKVLANDPLGYGAIRLLAILSHKCQKCAEDPEAWHTRGAFCKHKDGYTK